MINPRRLYDLLAQKGISFFTGVPDSLMKDFLNYLQEQAGKNDHVIAANEGLALALASGYYFQTGKLPLLYLQNSGLGNIINPLTSLADKEMYGVPMLIMTGWRGRPGTKDEPQHTKMGRITIPLLEALEVPFFVLEENEVASFEILNTAIETALRNSAPVAVLVPGNIFEEYKNLSGDTSYTLEREEVLRQIIDRLEGNETVICTTGKTGREFYEQNIAAGEKVKQYLLSVGAMGHAGHIALGISLGRASGTTVLLDGDGALLMHMGALATIPQHATGTFLHIVLNNGAHESVGGQPTAGFKVDLCKIAEACGYQHAKCINTEDELKQWLDALPALEGVNFIEIRIGMSSRKDLGRPAGEPANWKKDFMSTLKNTP